MASLYIFATGGTGAKVVQSLIFLLAAGAKIENVSSIVPILIDPHTDNHGLETTVRLIEMYQEIRSSLGQLKPGDFFYTEVMSLREKANQTDTLQERFTFQMIGDEQQANRFKDYINYTDFTPTDKTFVNLIFSESNLNTEMKIGFIGNPNIGSVVLNQFEDSREYEAFATSFAENDKIFIVSSIFGGTGASAFPVILKNIRSCKVGAHDTIQKAVVGALTVMPYFKVGAPDKGEKLIDENTFKSKTKAALHYYLHGVNPFVNRLYGISDRSEQSYVYDPGFAKQEKNKSHYVEMLGATAIFNFAQADTDIKAKNLYLEYGLSNEGAEEGKMTFKSMPRVTRSLIEGPLSRFTFMLRHLNHIDKDYNHAPAWTKSKDGLSNIDNSFKAKHFYQRLKQFLRDYQIWLTDMADNSRSFQPFLVQEGSHLNDTLVGIPLKNKKGIMDHHAIDEYLSEESDKQSSYPSPEHKFIQIFSNGLQTLLNNHYH